MGEYEAITTYNIVVSMRIKKNNTINKLLSILLMVLTILPIFGCSKSIKDIKFILNNQTVYIGQNIVIDYETIPEDANKEEIQIVSSDENILKNIEGNIFKAIKEGSSVITILNKDKEYDTCVIQVKPIEAESIKIASDDISIGIGNSYEPEILFYPSDTTYKEYTLLSSNDQIAKIDNNKIIGTSEGTTQITAFTSNNITTTFTVNIIPVIANSIEIQNTSKITIGDQVQLSLLWKSGKCNL